MSLDHTTTVVNGNRFAVPAMSQWFPTGYGPQTTGVPQVSPTMPPFLGGSPVNNSMISEVGGYGTADNNALMTQVAANNPWSLRHSPVIWAVLGLLVSLWLLRAIHWRETIEEGKASGRLGPLSAEAGEKVA